MTIDLTPFGFTPTESLAYAALLKLGPATGYAVAGATRLARANAYGALEGLVRRGAAARSSGRPARYRPVDPPALVALLAGEQGEALDRLASSLRHATATSEPVINEIRGARAVANVVLQIVARAEREARGVLAAELWRPTLPAWRRAATRATVDLQIAGDTDDTAGLARGVVPPDTPTLLLVDGSQSLVAVGTGDGLNGLWSSHPLFATLAGAALGSR